MKNSVVVLTMFLVGCISSAAGASVVYVDKVLDTNCTTGNYSIQNRNCGGSDGNAYTTVQAALNKMSTGDIVMMRGGTYQEGEITIPPAKNGTSWTEGNYNTLKSYPGEWAIIDGNNSLPNSDETAALGYPSYDKDGSGDLKYWKFERFEIKNGVTSNGTNAYGFWGNGGPFWFRYCYIHDNDSSTMNNNPAGITGMVWNNCIVEYCWFKDNGMLGSDHHNSGHIAIHSDYDCDNIASNGLTDNGHHIQQNTYRYNIFEGSTAVGIKYKNDQFLTGRRPGSSDYSDRYKAYGDKIHHNIFLDSLNSGVDGRQDFLNIYNNIFDGCAVGILAQEDDLMTMYKQVIYNNTIQNVTNRCIGWYNREYYSWQNDDVYGYNYNNILDDSNSYYIGLSGFSATNADNWVVDRTLFYRRASSADVLWVLSKDYTATEWEAARSGVDVYTAPYDSRNLLYQGTNGADKYRTVSTYELEAGKSVGSAGIGGSHPYLSGVTLPSYVGAANPNDDDWVDGVLTYIRNITWLKSVSIDRDNNDDPTWVEGGSGIGDPIVPLEPVQNLRIVPNDQP